VKRIFQIGGIKMMIRMAREEDFRLWLPLWQGYQSFYKTDIPESKTVAAPRSVDEAVQS
jgi:hypothetical protein